MASALSVSSFSLVSTFCLLKAVSRFVNLTYKVKTPKSVIAHHIVWPSQIAKNFWRFGMLSPHVALWFDLIEDKESSFQGDCRGDSRHTRIWALVADRNLVAL